jgi:hypothetical protein
MIAIAVFGVIGSAIFSYVYLSTSSYVRSRSDRAIMTCIHIRDVSSLCLRTHTRHGVLPKRGIVCHKMLVE